MNERLDDLMYQSGLTAQGCWDEMDDYAKQTIAKFAELIVAECAEIGDNYQEILGNEPECANCRKVAYGIVDKIKRHFGLEE